jgi:hypothetical protein
MASGLTLYGWFPTAIPTEQSAPETMICFFPGGADLRASRTFYHAGITFRAFALLTLIKTSTRPAWWA